MSRIEAIPLALDLFVAFDQNDEGHNLGLDLKIRFENDEFYLDDAIVTEASTGVYSARKDVAPNWLWRLIESDEGVRAVASKAWHENEARLADDAADNQREERRLSA